MVKHIVFWKMKEMPAEEREQKLRDIKKGFEGGSGAPKSDAAVEEEKLEK